MDSQPAASYEMYRWEATAEAGALGDTRRGWQGLTAAATIRESVGNEKEKGSL